MTIDASLNLADVIAAHGRRTPERPALITRAARVSWGELHSYVSWTAELLRRRGLQPGDRVAVASDDPIAFVTALGAACRCACAFVPVPTRLDTDALQRLLAHSSPGVLIADARDDDAALAAGDSTLPAADLVDVAREAYRGEHRYRCREAAFDDPFMILYTSGTTSAPRGIERNVGVGAAWRTVLARHALLNAKTVTAIATPLYSGMTLGCIMPTLAVGGTCVFCGVFTPERFIDLLQEERPTFCQLVPMHWSLLLQSPAFASDAFACFARLVCGGSRLDPGLKAELVSLFPSSFSEMYGTSESGALTDLAASAPRDKLASVGLPLDDCELRVLDVDGNPVAADREGEIAVRTTRLMTGYYNEAEPPAASWWTEPGTGRQFHRTGDVGRIDRDGYLWLHGRRNDVIVSGGFKIHPADIETTLLMHRDVAEAAVVGRADAILGETPVAFVVTKPGAAATAGNIWRWANQRLGKNQRLYRVQLTEQIPKNAAGKPLKKVLREMVEGRRA